MSSVTMTSTSKRASSVLGSFQGMMMAVSKAQDQKLSHYLKTARQNRDVKRAMQDPRLRTKLFLIMEEPGSSRKAMCFSIIMVFVIFASVICFVCETLISQRDNPLWSVFEAIFSIIFTCEVGLRLLVHPRLHELIVDPMFYVDLLAILPWYISLGLRRELDRSFSLLRVMRVLRVVKLSRHYPDSRILTKALSDSTTALQVPLFFLAIAVLVFASIVYFIEYDEDLDKLAETDDTVEPQVFTSIPMGIWFMVVTFTTVGYGDMSPDTAAGKVVTCVAMLFGVIFMSMPLSIVGSNFTKVWEEKEKMQVVIRVQERLLEQDLGSDDVARVFFEFDTTNNGLLSYAEFRSALVRLDIILPPSRMRYLFNIFDEDNNGEISLAEFCHVIFPDLDDSLLNNGSPGNGVNSGDDKHHSYSSMMLRVSHAARATNAFHHHPHPHPAPVNAATVQGVQASPSGSPSHCNGQDGDKDGPHLGDMDKPEGGALMVGAQGIGSMRPGMSEYAKIARNSTKPSLRKHYNREANERLLNLEHCLERLDLQMQRVQERQKENTNMVLTKLQENQETLLGSMTAIVDLMSALGPLEGREVCDADYDSDLVGSGLGGEPSNKGLEGAGAGAAGN